MIHPDKYRWMDVARYDRYVALLGQIVSRPWPDPVEVTELYGMLQAQDREPGPRHALISRLRRDRVIRRGSRLPIRYDVHPETAATVLNDLCPQIRWFEIRRADTVAAVSRRSTVRVH